MNLLQRARSVREVATSENYIQPSEFDIERVNDFFAEPNNISHVKSLIRLRETVTTDLTKKGLQSRIKFVQIVESNWELKELLFSSTAFTVVTSLSERAYDDCFEMGDGKLVASAIDKPSEALNYELF